MLTLDRIYHASYTLKDVIRRTDLISASKINPASRIYLKPENLQLTGSFKIRGSYYKISQLSDEEKAKGVIACSAGNHAQGVALGAAKNGIRSIICLPDGAPISKVEATKSYGAEVCLVEGVYDDAYQRALQMSLIADVAQAYFELVALDNELDIVRQTVDARRESLHLVRLRFEGGLISEIPYRQAQVELARTTALIPDLERQVTLKENELSLLVGEYPHRMERTVMLEDIRLPETLPVGLPSALLERRPDVRAAEKALMAANAEVGIALTSMFPQISLTGMLGFESDEVGNLLKSPYWFGAGDLLQPLVGLVKNKARHKVSQAQYEQEIYSYQKTVLNAFKEVNDAIIAIRKNKDITISWRVLESSADKYLQLAQLQYINGVTNYIDVLDAQRELLEAQIGLNDAVLNELLSIVQLYKALGGGYSEELVLKSIKD